MECAKITARGQCRRQAATGSHYCDLHAKSEDLITAYKLSDPKLNDDIKHHARASLADLSQQVVLLRALVQRRINMAGENEAEQLCAHNFAATQLAAITKMTETMVKLARESGDLMSRIEAEEFADAVMDIVSEELAAADVPTKVVDRIAERIAQEFSE